VKTNKEKQKKRPEMQTLGSIQRVENREKEGGKVLFYSGECVTGVGDEHASLPYSSVTHCYALDETRSAHGCCFSKLVLLLLMLRLLLLLLLLMLLLLLLLLLHHTSAHHTHTAQPSTPMK
jgi:hypothetical protein